MKILRDLIQGTGGLNENPFVRAARYVAFGAAIGGLDAASSAVAGLRLPDPAVTIPALLGLIAGAEKWVRNRALAPAPKR